MASGDSSSTPNGSSRRGRDSVCSHPKRILLMHLDLGIGGAENLMVQLACSMQDLGHHVTILTSHHDVNHCFEETKPNGRLGKHILVCGDWLPRHLAGKFTVFFAILRMLLLAVVVILWMNEFDFILLDGVAAPVPLLRLFGHKVMFYCHFPDLLLCTDRSSPLKKVYRFFMDAIEATATGASSLILVNSEFTGSVFRETFPAVYRKNTPQILYPAVNIAPPVDGQDAQTQACISYCQGYENVFFSLNRYERKKRIDIAIDAFYHFKQHLHASPDAVLVIAGGYDLHVQENVMYLQELLAHCDRLGLVAKHLSAQEECPEKQQVDVIFRTSISSTERLALFSVAKALLYTPDREHFGIVPIEAMMQETPVIAVNSGGPTESVRDGETGFLCPQEAKEFAHRMWKLVHETQDGAPLYQVMGRSARRRVIKHFSDAAMKEHLSHYIDQIVSNN